MTGRLLSVREVVERLGVHRSTAYEISSMLNESAWLRAAVLLMCSALYRRTPTMPALDIAAGAVAVLLVQALVMLALAYTKERK